ncbi:hypothetical protein BDV34DRAFT_22919 [Aspergillus parasiticus]|uniref:Uncharacterized protein n=2 Tax=Aspergillus subgen. Circumdati TaxID=2720871 RepID=A0A5N6D4C1_ASPPA|nr:hypothetical protein BDV34DRAFT_22919 [Aspergillus parasiticus]KAE8306185.1 hypothetical protein BDV41DRAFT_196821 [Aspergillus transmontanensis]
MTPSAASNLTVAEYITYHMYHGDMISLESFPDELKCVLFSAVVVGPETHTELNSTPSVLYGIKPDQTGPNGTKISVVKFYSPPTPLPAVPRSRGLSDHPLQKRLGFARAPSFRHFYYNYRPSKGSLSPPEINPPPNQQSHYLLGRLLESHIDRKNRSFRNQLEYFRQSFGFGVFRFRDPNSPPTQISRLTRPTIDDVQMHSQHITSCPPSPLHAVPR